MIPQDVRPSPAGHPSGERNLSPLACRGRCRLYVGQVDLCSGTQARQPNSYLIRVRSSSASRRGGAGRTRHLKPGQDDHVAVVAPAAGRMVQNMRARNHADGRQNHHRSVPIGQGARFIGAAHHGGGSGQGLCLSAAQPVFAGMVLKQLVAVASATQKK